jgi:hypothetical protein
MRHSLITLVILWVPPAAAAGGCPSQPEILQRWFDAVGEAQPDEDFGHLLMRTARAQLGAPYSLAQTSGEAPRCDLASFNCVTLVESALAAARCIWIRERTAGCFADELTNIRYRDGEEAGEAARLYYLSDWLEDVERRGLAESLTAALGGRAVQQRFFHLTQTAQGNPAPPDAAVLAAVWRTEVELSARRHWLLPRDQIKASLPQLRDGDIIAIDRRIPGLLGGHRGIVMHDARGRVQLLHASSRQGRVVTTRADLAAYVDRFARSRGIVVARPLPPRLGDAWPGAQTRQP